MIRGPFRFPIARAVAAVERDVSHVDAIAAFARRELELVLEPWQLEVIGMLLEERAGS